MDPVPQNNIISRGICRLKAARFYDFEDKNWES